MSFLQHSPTTSWAMEADKILAEAQAKIEDALHRERLLQETLDMLREKNAVWFSLPPSHCEGGPKHIGASIHHSFRCCTSACRTERPDVKISTLIDVCVSLFVLRLRHVCEPGSIRTGKNAYAQRHPGGPRNAKG